LFGGDPLPEKRHIYWNFVASEKEDIEEAKRRWRAKEFSKVPNDDTYVSLPS
jgi:redox-sensitive bicupin YhaK (pirin superfamily)